MNAGERLIAPVASFVRSPAGLTGLRSWMALGLLAAAAAALQVLEAPLPRVLPWLKPGLANAVTLIALVGHSARLALGVALLRSVLGGLALGNLLTPPFFLSLVGAAAAAVTMAAVRRGAGARLSLVGVSVLGAVANNLAQLALIEQWFAAGLPLLFNLSVMIWVSIPSGVLVARVAEATLHRLQRISTPDAQGP